jgi:hypothetical protein
MKARVFEIMRHKLALAEPNVMPSTEECPSNIFCTVFHTG